MYISNELFLETFDKLNRAYFENSLPYITYKPSSSKCYLGRFNVSPTTAKSYIALSSLLLSNQQAFENTLAHEMIHYYVWYKGFPAQTSHDYYFLAKMHEINNAGKHKITVSSLVSKSIDSEPVNGNQTYYGFICEGTKKAEYFVFVVNLNYIENFRYRLKNMVENRIIQKYQFFTSSNGFFRYFKQCRNRIYGSYLNKTAIEKLGILESNNNIQNLEDIL